LQQLCNCCFALQLLAVEQGSIRGAIRPTGLFLGDYSVDLHVLHDEEPHHLARMEVDHGETLQNESDITRSSAELTQQKELCVNALQVDHGSVVAHSVVPEPQQGYVDEFPGPDFVHFLGFEVLSRC